MSTLQAIKSGDYTLAEIAKIIGITRECETDRKSRRGRVITITILTLSHTLRGNVRVL